MKSNRTLFPKNIKSSIALIALIGTALSFTSCKKSDPIQRDASALSITNASPLRDSVDFYQGSQRLNSAPLLYGITYNYLAFTPGTINVGVSRPNNPKTFYNTNITLTNAMYQSLYIINKGDSTSFLLLKDNFIAPAAGQGKIRFVNLSSDSPAYDLVLEGDTTAFKNRAFKEFTEFKSIKPAKYKVSLVNTTTKAVAATLTDVEIAAGNFYTIYAKGLLGSTVDAKKISLKSSLHRLQ
ncbi:hypothetical protein HDE68_003810 [Pedobacter cryoconitis]|uniref:DUF4397 domain-containing protein n=1 Tax=Pedobacter cryoconitis TaxID=188932 RepID=A0A7W9E1P1_9SPHI|nr:DUF4397 domain-containing protein [Pedobacter cryoconitis]MBB5637885.1 hypothetical protein [Pedobacter cryoconitis]